jgi:hypothetical protein
VRRDLPRARGLASGGASPSTECTHGSIWAMGGASTQSGLSRSSSPPASTRLEILTSTSNRELDTGWSEWLPKRWNFCGVWRDQPLTVISSSRKTTGARAFCSSLSSDRESDHLTEIIGTSRRAGPEPPFWSVCSAEVGPDQRRMTTTSRGRAARRTKINGRVDGAFQRLPQIPQVGKSAQRSFGPVRQFNPARW